MGELGYVYQCARRCELEDALVVSFGQCLSRNLVRIILEFTKWPALAIPMDDDWNDVELVDDRSQYDDWYIMEYFRVDDDHSPTFIHKAKMVGFANRLEICTCLADMDPSSTFLVDSGMDWIVESAQTLADPVARLLTWLDNADTYYGDQPEGLERLHLSTAARLRRLKVYSYSDLPVLTHPNLDSTSDSTRPRKKRRLLE